jgi:polyferredoxin
MGFTKSSLVSVSDVFRLTDMSVPEFKFSLAWYAFMLFVVGSTVLWGRVYCGRVCAFGALTQLMDPILPRKMRIEIPVRIEKHANLIKYVVLAGVLVYYLVTKDVAGPIRYAEPFWMFSLFGSTGMWVGLAVLLVATVFVRNLYCRFLCPVGAALGLISQVTTVFSIKRWAECKTCKICEKTCEWGAIRGPQIVKSECVRCDDCERLYMDQQKCPHWLILYKRKGNAAVPVPNP